MTSYDIPFDPVGSCSSSVVMMMQPTGTITETINLWQFSVPDLLYPSRQDTPLLLLLLLHRTRGGEGCNDLYILPQNENHHDRLSINSSARLSVCLAVCVLFDSTGAPNWFVYVLIDLWFAVVVREEFMHTTRTKASKRGTRGPTVFQEEFRNRVSSNTTKLLVLWY